MRKVAACLAVLAATSFIAAPALAAGPNASSKGKAGGVHTAASSNLSGWAIVNDDGTLAKGSNAVSSQNVGFDAGSYEVIFNSKLKSCAFTASIGSAVAADPLPYNIVVSPRGGNIKGVYVHVTDLSGNPASAGFHLVVTCS
jgi:hypothetical protein